MNNPGLIKNFTADGAISKYRIVKFNDSDTDVVQASAATDSLIGVNGELDISSGERVDIVMTGIAEVEYGGTVTRGQPLTSDTDGKAIYANPATGVNNNIIGLAMASGVSGDIGSVLLSPGIIQGA